MRSILLGLTLLIISSVAQTALPVIHTKPLYFAQCKDMEGTVVNYSGDKLFFTYESNSDYRYVKVRTSAHSILYPIANCVVGYPK